MRGIDKPVAVGKVWAAPKGTGGLIKLPRHVLHKAGCRVGDAVMIFCEPGRITLDIIPLARETEPKAPSELGPRREPRRMPPAAGAVTPGQAAGGGEGAGIKGVERGEK